ncbi:ATP-binding protein [Arthrobacter sp. I2-34]|uniref:ATP-binding protein n=1 Tax=Arthrobacter hankyongi TaxID=2904801 RepID=A0ABS9L2Y7_9MICC|nr:ATP-binding protein [Arthrobacter hankyongi]MCG2620857.1 ATP-binding protein [Arthrobacter hankyongi]
MTDFLFTPTTNNVHVVMPDPRVAGMIGLSHDLESALADIVDNAVDAGAHNVLIRHLFGPEDVQGLAIVDDGRGMSEWQLLRAMEYGRDHQHDAGDLGHFGVGLKAASLSQAKRLDVFTRRHRYMAVGAGMTRESVRRGRPEIASHNPEAAERALTVHGSRFPVSHGTVVQWTGLFSRPRRKSVREIETWIDARMRRISRFLGTTFHRLIESGRLVIQLDMLDTSLGEAGSSFTVEPLDPFALLSSVSSPTAWHFTTSVGDIRVVAEGKIIAFSERTDPQFVLTSQRDAAKHQGIYVYRNDRLLQAGGWNGLADDGDTQLGFARVRMELSEELEGHLRFNPEKAGVEFSEELLHALLEAHTDDGQTFEDFLRAARDEDENSRKRQRQKIFVVRPVAGVPASVRQEMKKHFGFDEDAEDVTLRWRMLADDVFFEVDRRKRVLVLNKRYYEAITGCKNLTDREAPLVTTMMHLLLEDVFRGQKLGPRQNARLEAIQAVLVAAAHAEQEAADKTARAR